MGLQTSSVGREPVLCMIKFRWDAFLYIGTSQLVSYKALVATEHCSERFLIGQHDYKFPTISNESHRYSCLHFPIP